MDNMEDLPEDLYLGAVYDALNMVVDDPEKYVLGMKPMAGYEKLVHGPAFTIGGAHVNKTDDFDALDGIRYTMYKPELYRDKPLIVLGVGCKSRAWRTSEISRVKCTRNSELLG